MLLYITGTVNGKTYNEEVVDPAVLLSELDLEVPPMLEFRVVPERVSIDVAGNRNVPHSTNLPNQTDVVIPAKKANFRMVCAENRVVEGGGKYTYAPYRIENFKGESLAIVFEDAPALFVFYYLNKKNVNSPAFKPGSPALYRTVDRQKESETALAQARIKAEIGAELMSISDEMLLVKARGMMYRGAGQQLVTPMLGLSPGELRIHMIGLLDRDGNAFVKGYRDTANYLRGLLMLALDRSIVLSREINGMVTYYWDEMRGGNEIVTSMASQAESNLLLTFQQRYDELMPKLTGALSVDTLSKIEVALPEPTDLSTITDFSDKALMTLDTNKVLALAIEHEVVDFDRVSLQVRLIDGSGSVVKSIYDASSPKEWKSQFATALRSPKFIAVKKLIVEELQKRTAYEPAVSVPEPLLKVK